MKAIIWSFCLAFSINLIAQTNTTLGTNAGNSGNYNTSVGYNAGDVVTGDANSFFGYLSGKATTSGIYNAMLGSQTGFSNTTGGGNSFVGYAAGYLNTSGSYNSFLGRAAGYNNTTGTGNTLTGHYSGFNSTIAGYNTANGYEALLNTTTGSNNAALGYRALYTNTTGSNNAALGYGADVSTGALTNATAIGSGAIVSTSNTIQMGNSSVTQVLVGTGTSATLIVGGLKITGGTPAAGKVLTSDASGAATWQTPTSGSWATSGANIYSSNTGNVGIGVTSPGYKLDVAGTINATNLYVAGQPYKSSQWTTSTSDIYFSTGNVSIGTNNPQGYRLAVAGKIVAEEIVVKLQANWPDYVFDVSYKPMSLEEIDAYIKEHKHLPGVPSAKEIQEKGISVGEMNAILLKKIEELTIEMISLKKELLVSKGQLK